MGGAEGLEALQLLLKEYPKAAQEKDNDGDLCRFTLWRSNMGGAEGLRGTAAAA
jgi:hypothetical protein